MMVVDVVPKDIHYLVDLSGGDLKSMKVILDNMEFKCDTGNTEHVEANDFLHNVFYPMVSKLIEEVENHGP